MNIDMFFINLMEKIQNNFLDNIFTNFVFNKISYIWILFIITLLLIKKTRKIGLIIAFSFIITFILGEGILKRIVARPRPFLTHHLSILVKAPKSFSFPSGHTSLTFAVFGCLLFMRNKYTIFFGILAVLVGISRIYLKVHYFSDVLAGMILGILVSYVVVNFYKRYVKIRESSII